MLPRPHPDTRNGSQLRIVGLGMIAGVVAFALVAAFVAHGRPLAPGVPAAAVWLLAGVAVALLAVSFVLDTSTRARRLVALALREAAGLIGALATLGTGDPAWAAALGALSVAALVAGLPRGGDPAVPR